MTGRALGNLHLHPSNFPWLGPPLPALPLTPHSRDPELVLVIYSVVVALSSFFILIPMPGKALPFSLFTWLTLTQALQQFICHLLCEASWISLTCVMNPSREVLNDFVLRQPSASASLADCECVP